MCVFVSIGTFACGHATFRIITFLLEYLATKRIEIYTLIPIDNKCQIKYTFKTMHKLSDIGLYMFVFSNREAADEAISELVSDIKFYIILFTY